MANSHLPLDSFMPYRLSFTAGLVSEHIAHAYETQFGIDVPQWRVLAWIAERDGITQQEICQRTRMDKVSVSRAAIALNRRGLVERRPHARDGRSHMLALTPSGISLYEQIVPRARELESRIFAQFSDEEREGFMAILRKIDAAATALHKAGTPGHPPDDRQWPEALDE
ncbi:DNA-binding MarR family transcriptional regulator [Sphingobium fontiphilum]|uniref:DNA-binding MarR family transcriptional regulator n=1 Tax=Sphingobium fontiphilum TaxID=944425 RepID=A0A7W6DEE6_9SPHN|nr:MarR family winged helix-turn-helix transcriptional regulator [Sphingobium fontiphilum]MBB3981715.1 DNA-binding MarR family transcriptional regulator [Sphingobium fontiphilum]